MARSKAYLSFVEGLSDHDLLTHHWILVRLLSTTKEDMNAIWGRLRTEMTIKWNGRILTQQDYVQITKKVDYFTEQLQLCEEELESRGRFAIERQVSTSQDTARGHAVRKTTGNDDTLVEAGFASQAVTAKE